MKLTTGKELLPQDDQALLYEHTPNFQSMPESDLWELFKGDARAFNHVYLRYFPILYNYGHQFTKDRELVKDVIQDLFIYLKEKSAKLGRTTSIKFYLYRAYRRRIRRYLRIYNRGASETSFEDAGFEVALPHESHIINSAINEELKVRLEQAFAALSRRQREIVMYYYFEGFSYQQITSVMGFAKVQYARILMSRTIARLRKELENRRSTL